MAKNGLTVSGTLTVLRRKKLAPRMIVTISELPSAIFTSGARSSERNVASATAADCSGANGMERSRKLGPLLGRAAGDFPASAETIFFTVALPPLPP